MGPGGGLDRNCAARLLVAVLAGTVSAVGDQAPARRDLTVGYGAVWEAGERARLSSASGCTAVLAEGSFDVRAMAVTQDIVVADYDEDWPRWFAVLEARLWPAVQGVALRVDHVGSTAVPGLPAKPVIDLDVVVASADDFPAVIEALARLGYRWRGDLGVEGREAFDLAEPADLPRHHLYLVVENSKAHLDHVLLRDLLRTDPEARHAYGELKRHNAATVAGDMDRYVAAKAALVAELLTRARQERGLPPAEYWVP